MSVLFWLFAIFAFFWGIYWSFPHERNTYLKKINWGKLGIYLILLVGFVINISYLFDIKKEVNQINKKIEKSDVIFYVPYEQMKN